MSTHTALTLHRPHVLPWLRRLLAPWRGPAATTRSRPAMPMPDFDALAGLSDHSLRDIGAPDCMIGRERGPWVSEFERARY